MIIFLNYLYIPKKIIIKNVNLIDIQSYLLLSLLSLPFLFSLLKIEIQYL